MGASPEEKQPILPPVHGSSRRREESLSPGCICSLCFAGLVAAYILFTVWMWWYTDQSGMPPEYSVAITAVSGLTPASEQSSRGLLLSPVFNMTVGLASHSALSGGCIEPGTAVRVSYSYLRLPMASGRVPDVARGCDVAMPGFLVDSLAEDMRRGEAAFEVKLTSLEEKRWKVVTCWVRAGNAGAGAAKPCVQSFTRINQMPELQPG